MTVRTAVSTLSATNTVDTHAEDLIEFSHGISKPLETFIADRIWHLPKFVA